MLAEVHSPVFYVTGTQPDSLRMPMVPIRPMFFPVTDPHLSNKIMYQIDYYFRYLIMWLVSLMREWELYSVYHHLDTNFLFIHLFCSNENLVKDTFLRQNMDEEGWVPIQLIAGFRKVSCLEWLVSLFSFLEVKLVFCLSFDTILHNKLNMHHACWFIWQS